MGYGNKSICLVIGGLCRAGAETQLVRITKGLKDKGWNVSLLSILKPEAFENELRDNDIPLYTLGARKGQFDPGVILRYLSVINRIKPGFILSFMFHSNLLVRFGALINKRPIIINSIRGERFGEGEWSVKGIKIKLRELLIRYSNYLARMVTTNSVYAGKKLLMSGIITDNRLKIIPNCINISNYSRLNKEGKELRLEKSLRDNDFLWLNVARLQPVKDHRTLIKAFKLHSRKYENSRLWIVGGGENHKKLNSLIKTLNLQNKVFLCGEQQDVPRYYSAANGFALSSKSEGLPNVLLEAHASKLPAISTDCGGAKEIINEKVSGFIVPVGDFKKMAKRMNEICDLEKKERESMGEAGYKYVKSKFNYSSVIDLWEDVILKAKENF